MYQIIRVSSQIVAVLSFFSQCLSHPFGRLPTGFPVLVYRPPSTINSALYVHIYLHLSVSSLGSARKYVRIINLTTWNQINVFRFIWLQFRHSNSVYHHLNLLSSKPALHSPSDPEQYLKHYFPLFWTQVLQVNISVSGARLLS